MQAGSFNVDMDFSVEERAAIDAFLAELDLQLTTEVWQGGPCCFSMHNEPNQCCNPPDMGPVGVPGNHCECFELRGYPFPYAVAPLT
jgi:hypothetical protein